MSFDITLDDKVTTALDQLAQRLAGINEVIGESGQRVLMDHLAAKEADAASHKTARRLGAEPTGVFSDMARSLSRSMSGATATVSINHLAARLHYFGGTITPQRSKYLTIPVAAEAYGKSLGAGDFSGPLKWLFGRKGPYAVAKASAPENILFILAKSATIPKMPTLLPDESTWITGILDTVLDALGLEAANG